MQDVADRAGVSRAAVSLALRNHPSLPVATRERIQALAEGSGISIRYSYTLESYLMYVAVPLSESRETGVIRVAVPLSTMKEALSSMRVRLLSGALLAIILVTVLTLFFSQRILSLLR